MSYAPIEPGRRSVSPVNSETEHVEFTKYSSHPTGVDAPPNGLPPRSEIPPTKEGFQGQVPPQWPSESQRVWVVTPLRAFIIAFDIVFASTPLMFIALALIAGRLDGEKVSPYGLHLHQVLLVSPTIFPVIFAALMGRCFKSVALFLAGRGTTLGRLEQLVGCQSLFSSLERQISLRSGSVVGITMLLLWLLSPLGGQSALRLLDQENHVLNSTGTSYMNPLANQESFLMGASALNSGRSLYMAVYITALLASTRYQNAPMDVWGNVKLPSYRSIEKSTSDAWKIIPDKPENTIYASLIGIPVANIPSSGHSNFSIKGRQWDISCDDVTSMNANQTDYGSLTSTFKLNYTTKSLSCGSYPCPISFKSLSDSDPNTADKAYTVASCDLTFQYLEALVNCDGKDCAATRMRKLDLFTDGYTNDLDDFFRSVIVRNSFFTLPTMDLDYDGSSSRSSSLSGSTNPERWMDDPENFVSSNISYVQLYKLPLEKFTQRLNIVYNTLFQSTYAPRALVGNLPKNLTSLSDSESPGVAFNSTMNQYYDPSTRVYKTNWTWFSLLLASSIILQIAAYVGLVLKYWTCVPDIMGYASSMTLMNPYVPVPTGSTTLHGLERAALLHDLPVRIGDVCPDDPVGAIAFAKADDRRVARLDRKRFYT